MPTKQSGPVRSEFFTFSPVQSENYTLPWVGHAKSMPYIVNGHFKLLLLMVIRTKFSLLLSPSGNFKIIAYNYIAT